MPDAAMKVLPPFIQRFQSTNVKGILHAGQVLRSFYVDDIAYTSPYWLLPTLFMNVSAAIADPLLRGTFG